MEKILVYTVMSVLALLLAFFGLGPVILADGSMIERIVTLLIVLALYGVLFLLFRSWQKRRAQK
ncbi:DUF6954 family protein [Brevibacillus sp. SYSU BS000544]|uniref:DUF6954 family protein n=1 Tax=Brevibacillus sp. SYSU BS000544 TaxID=3416443 RepID=UPI003CE48367